MVSDAGSQVRDPYSVLLVALDFLPKVLKLLATRKEGAVNTVGQLRDLSPADLFRLNTPEMPSNRRIGSRSYGHTCRVLHAGGWISDSALAYLTSYHCTEPPYSEVAIRYADVQGAPPDVVTRNNGTRTRYEPYKDSGGDPFEIAISSLFPRHRSSNGVLRHTPEYGLVLYLLEDMRAGYLPSVGLLLAQSPAYLFSIVAPSRGDKPSRAFNRAHYELVIMRLYERGWITERQYVLLLSEECLTPPYQQIPIRDIGKISEVEAYLAFKKRAAELEAFQQSTLQRMRDLDYYPDSIAAHERLFNNYGYDTQRRLEELEAQAKEAESKLANINSQEGEGK